MPNNQSECSSLLHYLYSWHDFNIDLKSQRKIFCLKPMTNVAHILHIRKGKKKYAISLPLEQHHCLHSKTFQFIAWLHPKVWDKFIAKLYLLQFSKGQCILLEMRYFLFSLQKLSHGIHAETEIPRSQWLDNFVRRFSVLPLKRRSVLTNKKIQGVLPWAEYSRENSYHKWLKSVVHRFHL